ncbi:MAG: pentapeptide repeat-containing protein [Armatimonadetes bacterium]|nr:pentapeptide repeat-containing protein [Armatimonadota bacterium]MDE2205645.1 pentapeptide repeat-containing protein [Armatimonadota bacterium]
MANKLRSITAAELTSRLDAHRRWVRQEQDAQPANFAHCSLRNVDLSDQELSNADFTGADLTGADLRGSFLSGAEFHEAVLRDTRLQRSTLWSANMSKSTDLTTVQLSGADLRSATLPANLHFDAIFTTRASVKSAVISLVVYLTCAAWVLLALTAMRDATLFVPQYGATMPLTGVEVSGSTLLVLGPLLVGISWIYLAVAMQRLWERLALLPAVFTDGLPVDITVGGGALTAIVRAWSPTLRSSQPAVFKLQVALVVLLVWGAAPVTAAAFWLRGLRAHNWIVSGLHVALVSLFSGVAVAFYLRCVQTLTSTTLRRGLQSTSAAVTMVAVALITAAASYGGINGVPIRAQTEGTGSGSLLERVVPLILRGPLAPFAQMADTELSRHPSDWRGTSPADFALVRGAQLQSVDLRGANMGIAFLVRANMRWAHLRRAILTDADLRYARLRGADLREADMRGINLRNADLTDANLTGADLTGADLRGASFLNANLNRARLLGADCRGASFSIANMAGADLREANLLSTSTGVTGISQDQLTQAVTDAGTKVTPPLVVPQ